MTAEVLRHLEAQIASARRLLELVLAQGRAIRARDVEGVVRHLGEVQAEMTRRGTLEEERTRLLTGAGARLGINAADVTLERLTALMAPEEAATARERSAALRGLLAEIAREHGTNRTLMRQELRFLDHLTRLIGAEGDAGGYRPPAESAAARAAAAPSRPLHALDLRA